jgi:signal transduction histidine kinase
MMFKPFWLEDALLLTRQVQLGRTSVVQGVWLNWTNLFPSLLTGIADLFPNARLRPAPSFGDGHDAPLLASLPIQLIPGSAGPGPDHFWSPVRLSLGLAWIFVGFAAGAIALLLHGTVSLSERRAAFVSAVTHELRTPLMTFRMYSEMLADGMVPEEAQRREYLNTLCAEASRLSHLVENVLAYARLERRGSPDRLERVALAELVRRVVPRLIQRTEQAGLRLVEKIDPPAASATLPVDVSAIEQILFNLVDNACKYAARGNPNEVELEASLDRGGPSARVRLRVRDFGPGVSRDVARRLFQPFSKSADEAAHSAPGVGLGLALCRDLSRSMGGELQWIEQSQGGACFELSLPVEASGGAKIG